LSWTFNPETEEIDYYEAGVTDHGALTGLGDDDHTIYALAGASRVGTISVELNSAINQDVTTDASPTWVTAKLTGLTDGYVPYHVSDATGLANSCLSINNAAAGKISHSGTTPWKEVTITGLSYPSVAYYPLSVNEIYPLTSGCYFDSVNWKWSRSGQAAFRITESIIYGDAYGFAFQVANSPQSHVATDTISTWANGLALSHTDQDIYVGIGYGAGSPPRVNPLSMACLEVVAQTYAQAVFGTNSTNYPGMSFYWTHGAQWIGFDAYYNSLSCSVPVAAGGAITWALGLSVDLDGDVGIGCYLPAARLELEDGGTANTILFKITQDDANVYGLVIGNDTYSTTDTLGLRLSLGSTGSAIVENSGALDLILRAIGTANASDVYLQAEDKIFIEDYAAGTPVTKATWDVINGRLGIGMAPTAGLLQVGDGTNYSELEADGTLKFAGTATVWKDINLGAAQLGQPASGAPSAEKWVDEAGGDTGIYTLAFALNEYVSGSFEMQHDYKEGSDVTFHVHWQGITAPAGGTDNVRWELTYTIARDDNTINAVTVTTSADSAINAQYKMIRTNFTAITGSTGGVDGGNIKIGDQFLFKLKRVAASADEYAGDAYLATCGLHYEIDTVGSRTIGAK
jgi:hypothetical protein